MKNITREPWVTKYGYASNPSFMKGEGEKQLRRKWVYTRQRHEDRYGYHNGTTTIKEIDQELRDLHYIPGAVQFFKGECQNILADKKEETTGERAPWVDIAFSEFEKYKGLREIDSPLKEKVHDYFTVSSTGARKPNGTLWNYTDPWCGAFVAWCFDQTTDYKRIIEVKT